MTAHCLGVLSSTTSMNSLSILWSAENSWSAFCPPRNSRSFLRSWAGAMLR